MSGRRPTLAARALLALAVRAVPRGRIRQRYDAELAADLYALDRPAQFMYSFRTLLTSRALGRAVRSIDSLAGEAAMTNRKPLLCRWNIKHHWAWVNIPDTTDRYLVCDRCGKEGGGASARAVNGAIVSSIVSNTGSN